jgi:hypothetical protein
VVLLKEGRTLEHFPAKWTRFSGENTSHAKNGAERTKGMRRSVEQPETQAAWGRGRCVADSVPRERDKREAGR